MSYIPQRNVISDLNSTEVPLAASGTFTGDAEDVSQFDSVVVAVKTDQNGTFTIQFSTDGVNWDSTLTRYYRTNQIEAPHRFTITRKYCRVTFTNTSGSAQTYMRLQTVFGNKGELNTPIDSVLAQDFDSISVRPTDWHTEVALSRRQGATLWNKFGYNEDIDTATDPEIIASWGGTFTYVTTAETIDIVSTSTNDDGDPAGTGAQQVIIWGVDANWDEQIEIVTMDGTSTVTTTSTWLGINRVSIYAAGTGKKNDGTINVTGNSSSTQFAQMPAGEGTTQQCIFYVPQNHTFLADWLFLNGIKTSGGGNPEVTFKVWVYSAVANAEFEVFRASFDTTVNEYLEIKPPRAFVIGEKSIMWVTAETSSDNTSVRCRFTGEVIRDVDA